MAIIHAKHSLLDWIYKVGNSIEYQYYTGVEADNPSGSKNIKKMLHKDGQGFIVFVITMQWDINDNIIEQKTTTK